MSLGVINGKRLRKVFYGESKEEVREKLKASQNNTAIQVEPSKERLGTFLTKWLENQKHALALNTYLSYKGVLDRNIIPALGLMPVGTVQPVHVRAYFDTQRLEGKSATVLNTAKTVLNQAFDQAEIDGLVSRNPARAIRLRASRKTKAAKEVVYWTQEETLKFLETAKTHEFFPIYALALTTGMRFGEILGLQWTSLDFATGVLSITHQLLDVPGKGIIGLEGLKTESSKGNITLTPEMVRVLEIHRISQVKRGHGDLPQMFTGKTRKYLYQTSVRRAMKHLMETAGIKRIHFHAQRHTHATHLLQAGERIEVVSARLRHASPSITSDIYTHVPAAMDQGAADKIARLIPVPTPEAKAPRDVKFLPLPTPEPK